MAPTILIDHGTAAAATAFLHRRDTVDGQTFGDWRDEDTQPETYIIESWGEGFMVGALLIMACITVANMRKGVLLHKLILLEVRWLCEISRVLVQVSAEANFLV